MRKTFQLSHPKIKVPRVVEGVKHDLRKYIKRERRHELPEGVDFWDFDCKYGNTQDTAKPVHISELSKCLDAAEAEQLPSCYVEILAKHGHRTKKPKSITDDTTLPHDDTALPHE